MLCEGFAWLLQPLINCTSWLHNCTQFLCFWSKFNLPIYCSCAFQFLSFLEVLDYFFLDIRALPHVLWTDEGFLTIFFCFGTVIWLLQDRKSFGNGFSSFSITSKDLWYPYLVDWFLHLVGNMMIYESCTCIYIFDLAILKLSRWIFFEELVYFLVSLLVVMEIFWCLPSLVYGDEGLI